MLHKYLEVIQQAKNYLVETTTENYQSVMRPHFQGSAGQHMRHILDHFIALERASKSGCVDYNQRSRCSHFESSPTVALKQWQTIETWLNQLQQTDLSQSLQVVTEYYDDNEQPIVVTSTMARELAFVNGHAVHHFSQIACILSLQGDTSPQGFGVAPATLRFHSTAIS